MARSHKIFGFLFVTFLGAYGCAKGPTAPTESSTAAAKMQKLEDDHRTAIASRDQMRLRLATVEDQSAKTKKDLEQQLEQTRTASATERDALKAEVKVRTGERDALQMQYEGFRKTLRDMLGSADTAVGKMNLPLTQPTATTIGTARN